MARIWWIPVLVALAPLVRGFPRGHDTTFELVRVAEYGYALAGGQLPPAWAEHLYGGHGSPIFLFYAPLFAALASGAAALLGSVPWGAVLALSGFAVVGAFAIRRAGRLATGGSERGARVAVAVYLLHPYLLCDLLLRNANAEFAALCVAPVALCGVLELRERPRAAALWLAAGLALCIVSHNLTAVVLAAVSLCAGLWLSFRRGERSRWPWLAAGVLLGIGLAAFFWVPALALRGWVRTETMLLGKFDFHRQFPPLGSLFGYQEFYGAGLLPILLWLAAVFVILRTRRTGDGDVRVLRGLLAGALVLLLLMQPVTTGVWEALPLLPYLQFPWRLQGPLALFTALAAAIAVARLVAPLPRRWRLAVELGVLVLAIANALPHLLAAKPLGPRAAAWLSAALEPEAIRSGRVAATVLDEYLPRGAVEPAVAARRPGRASLVEPGDGAVLRVDEHRGSRIRLRVQVDEPTDFVFARWHFPGWRAWIDGAPSELEADAVGRIRIRVEPGPHALELRFVGPAARRIGFATSGLALAAWLALAWPSLTRRSRDGAASRRASDRAPSKEPAARRAPP